MSIPRRTSPPRRAPQAINIVQANSDSFLDEFSDHSLNADRNHKYPAVIEEVSEPVSPESHSSSQNSPSTSIFTEMIKCSPPIKEDDELNDRRPGSCNEAIRGASVDDAELSQPNEGTALLEAHKHQSYTSFCDIESLQKVYPGCLSKIRAGLASFKVNSTRLALVMANPKIWDRKKVWQDTVLRPAGYIPAIVLGLLLNVLDALSYGLILFPLGVPSKPVKYIP